MSKTRDADLHKKYRYRSSEDLITKINDCEILDTMLSFTFNPQIFSESPETNAQTEQLGKAYFEFLRNRLSHQRKSLTRDTYPFLGLVFDIYTAALYKGRPAILRNLGPFVDAVFGDVAASANVKDEIRRCVSNHLSRGIPIYNECIQAYSDVIPKEGKLDDSLKKIGHEAINNVHFLNATDVDFITTLESRIFFGLNRLSSSVPAYQYDQLLYSTPTIGRKVYQQAEEEASKRLNRIYSGRTKVLAEWFRKLFFELSHGFHYRQKEIEADLGTFIGNLDVPIKTVDNATMSSESSERSFSDYDLSQRLQAFKQADGRYKSYRKEEGQNLFFYDYLLAFWENIGKDAERIERENNFLWGEALNNAIWFISPRGDRFSMRKDPQLEERAINSLTLFVDKARPREHKVVINFIGIEEQMDFWLDTNRNLLGGSHQLLQTDPYLREAFTNLLLKRLYFISSGLLSKNDTEEQYVEEGLQRISFEYRRAHYRVLNSTPGRRITMESDGAKTHAREVKEFYGIDIFEEIKRRRALGTLKNDEYLTFVREVEPSERSSLVLPNEITFDPELLQIAA